MPAVAGEQFSPYGQRTGYGWADNTPLLASLATEFVREIDHTLDTTPT